MEFTVQITADKAEEESQYIEDQLRQFNLLYAEPDQHTMLKAFARNTQGEIIGGLLGETFWRWLYIADLWVREDYRHSGIGSELMRCAEAEAIRRGCSHAYLDTLTFQAPEFYPKLGYTPWGMLDDLPPGQQRIFFKKDL